jgi:hypothetical protein
MYYYDPEVMMGKNVKRILSWTPRGLGIVFAVFNS